MRIIAGHLGGRRLVGKVASATRPTSDRVREAIGSVLAARGAFEGAVVLDLFAGTGALGLEALSRGAVQLLAVDNASASLRAFDDNVRELRVGDQVTRLKLDLLQAPERVLQALASRVRPAAQRQERGENAPFSLVFADPPYRDLARVAPLLQALAESPLTAQGAFFVVEHAHGSALPECGALATLGHYDYGSTAVTLLARRSQMSEGVEANMASESADPVMPRSAAVYAGSFDPITNGHVAIIRSGLVAFDKIIVAVLTNTTKKPLFPVEERMEMIRDAVGGDDRVEVDRFDHGLLVDYARNKGVRVILRGLRAVGDFEHELQMANMNRHLARGIETVFIMANDYFYVSSTLIKEAAALGGDLHGIVPELVEKQLRRKFGR